MIKVILAALVLILMQGCGSDKTVTAVGTFHLPEQDAHYLKAININAETDVSLQGLENGKRLKVTVGVKVIDNNKIDNSSAEIEISKIKGRLEFCSGIQKRGGGCGPAFQEDNGILVVYYPVSSKQGFRCAKIIIHE